MSQIRQGTTLKHVDIDSSRRSRLGTLEEALLAMRPAFVESSSGSGVLERICDSTHVSGNDSWSHDESSEEDSKHKHAHPHQQIQQLSPEQLRQEQERQRLLHLERERQRGQQLKQDQERKLQLEREQAQQLVRGQRENQQQMQGQHERDRKMIEDQDRFRHEREQQSVGEFQQLQRERQLKAEQQRLQRDREIQAERVEQEKIHKEIERERQQLHQQLAQERSQLQRKLEQERQQQLEQQRLQLEEQTRQQQLLIEQQRQQLLQEQQWLEQQRAQLNQQRKLEEDHKHKQEQQLKHQQELQHQKDLLREQEIAQKRHKEVEQRYKQELQHEHERPPVPLKHPNPTPNGYAPSLPPKISHNTSTTLPMPSLPNHTLTSPHTPAKSQTLGPFTSHTETHIDPAEDRLVLRTSASLILNKPAIPSSPAPAVPTSATTPSEPQHPALPPKPSAILRGKTTQTSTLTSSHHTTSAQPALPPKPQRSSPALNSDSRPFSDSVVEFLTTGNSGPNTNHLQPPPKPRKPIERSVTLPHHRHSDLDPHPAPPPKPFKRSFERSSSFSDRNSESSGSLSKTSSSYELASSLSPTEESDDQEPPGRISGVSSPRAKRLFAPKSLGKLRDISIPGLKK